MELITEMSVKDWILFTILIGIWVNVWTWIITVNFKRWYSEIGPALVILITIFIAVTFISLKGLIFLLVD